MLPKNRRIQKKLFSNILLKGRRYNSPHFLIYISDIGDKTPSKFSFSISKKVCKLAVDRNRFRRQGYSIISRHLKDIPPGLACFFLFKKGLGTIVFKELELEIINFLKSIKLI